MQQWGAAGTHREHRILKKIRGVFSTSTELRKGETIAHTIFAYPGVRGKEGGFGMEVW